MHLCFCCQLLKSGCNHPPQAAFGRGEVFIEKLVSKPRHIEVQTIGDGSNTVHLFERDCSVQRRFALGNSLRQLGKILRTKPHLLPSCCRHQKVVEVAPAIGLAPELREQLTNWAVQISNHIGYKNAATVEFLVDTTTNTPYYLESNPRIQICLVILLT